MKLLLAAVLALGLAACSTLPSRSSVRPLPADALSSPDRFLVVTVKNTPVSSAARAASTVHGYDTAGSYTPAASARAQVNSIARDYRLREVSGWPIEILKVHCVVYRLAPDQTADAMVEALSRDSRVESVEPLHAYATLASGYNDPYRPLQRNLDTLSIEDAHRLSTGKGITVAVIDTGVDTEHVDLQGVGRRLIKRDFVDSGDENFRADRHGTEVAGLIAAVANNGIGIAGVAPDVVLYAFKACWYTNRATRAVCNSFTLGQALATAIDLKIRIVNLSLSGPPDPLLGRLLTEAVGRGMVVVGAVGEGSAPMFPADVPGVIAVEAAEDAAPHATAVLAPGRDILTLAPGGHYDFDSGSSLAAAEVSGTAALLLAVDPRATPEDVRRLLVASSRAAPLVAGAGASVNACAALAAAGSRSCTPLGGAATASGTQHTASPSSSALVVSERH